MSKRISLIFFLVLCCATFGFSQIRVACIGNSITKGYGLPKPEVYCYPAVLGKMLGKDYQVKNYGVSARTMLLKGDLPWMKEPQFRDVLKYNPQIVIIKLGTNDSKEQNWAHSSEFKKDMETLIILLQSLPAKPQIYLCYPIPAGENTMGIRESVIANEIIPMIKSVADEYNLKVIDLHTDMPEKYYSPDNVHPNMYGAKYIAEKVYDAIK